MSRQTKQIYEFGAYRIDADEGLMRREGEVVPLAPKVFDMLLVLIEGGGHVIAKEELMTRVWPDSFVEEANISRNIFTLRKALGDEYIETVPKRGNRFVAPVIALSLEDGEAATLEERSRSRIVLQEQHDAEVPTRSSAEYVVGAIKSHRKKATLVAAVSIIAVGAAIFSYFKPAPPLTERDTILLADFINTTGDAVFDDTLKQALAFQLEQSPFLNIFPDDGIRETLRFMGRSPDDRLTKEIAREICERRGLKALLSGSILGLGSHYVISLEATNAQTSEAIAREQVEAESKEQVLHKLGEAASRLRNKLGESLSTIQKFDAPIEQATTSSLEALKAFSLGSEQYAKGAYAEAVPFLERAIELDPNFALAYAQLAGVYYNLRQRELTAQFSQKAFELRDRVSEREKLSVSMRFYGEVIGDIEKTIEVLKLWKGTYPRDYRPPGNLSFYHLRMGQFEKGIEEARQAIQLDPNTAASYTNLGSCLAHLNRFAEAKAVLQQAMAQNLESLTYHILLYEIAFSEGDRVAMQQQVDWANGKPAEAAMLSSQAAAAAADGHLKKASEFDSRAVDLAERRNVKELAASYASRGGITNALFGDCRRARDTAAKALDFARSRESLINTALGLALCGKTSQAQSLVDELARRFPGDTLINTAWLPTIRAAIEINRNNTAQAIQLQVASRYEIGNELGLWPAYVRGLAYLRQGAGAEARAEFQRILDHRGVVRFPPSYLLAYLGLARATAIQGDAATARKAYQGFIALLRDADADIPILIEGKREYERLNQDSR